MTTLLLATLLIQSPGPGSRGHFGIAYDGKLHRVVVGNGASFPNNQLKVHDDLWSWDGTKWHSEGSTGLTAMGVTYLSDPVKNRLYEIGGFTADNRELNDWNLYANGIFQKLGSAPFAPRADVPGAFDTKRGVAVLYESKSNQFHEWDGKTWKGVKSGLPSRDFTSMAFDEKRGTVVLFGGRPPGLDVPLNDTWIYDGTKATRAEADGPAGSWAMSMAYDAAREMVVLHGGMNPNGDWQGTTWGWEGTKWTKLSDNGPAMEGAIAYDRDRKVLVFFGTPTHMENSAQTQTWEWDGKAWAKKEG